MNDKNLSKKLTAILLMLIAIAIIIIAFVGIYLQKLNKLQNIVPEAKYGADIKGFIEYRLNVDKTENEKKVYVDENGNILGEVENGSKSKEDGWENTTGYTIETKTIKTNQDEALTKENFEKTKSILEKRLNLMNATDYEIRVDDETGDMVIGLSNDDNYKYLFQTGIASVGKIEIIDYQTGVVLIDGSHIKNAREYTYSTDGTSYTVYLQLELDDEGTETLKNLSNKYIQYTDSNGQSQTDYISVQMDGAAIYTTYFGEEYTSNTIAVPIGSNISSTEDLNTYVDSVKAIAGIINNGKLPVVYNTDVSGYLVKTNIDNNFMLCLKIILIIGLVLITVLFTVKYKFKGFLGGIINASYIGLVIIVLKLLSITISISSLFTIAGLVLVNTLFIVQYLRYLNSDIEKPYLKTLQSFYGSIFPIIVIAFVFTIYSKNEEITGIGMTLFWGLIMEIIFNSIILRNVLKLKSKK